MNDLRLSYQQRMQNGALQRLWHIAKVQYSIREGRTVHVVGPTGMDRAPYLAGLTAEEQSRLTFSEPGGI